MSDDAEKDEPAPVSKIGRRQTRAGYRSGRSSNRSRAARAKRICEELPIANLIGKVIELRNITNAVREQCIAIAWRDIVGESMAKDVVPDTLFRGVLTVWTSHPSRSHELHFSKSAIVEQINRWAAARQAWLGTAPPVIDLRAKVGTPRHPVVDPDDLRLLKYRYRRRAAVPRSTPGIPPTEAELEAITIETSAVEDAELRETIRSLRATWNR